MTLRWNPKAGAIAGILMLLLAAAVVSSGWRDAAPAERISAAEPDGLGAMRAGAYDPPHPAPDFSLPGSDGSRVSLARFRGKVVLLTFGFTYCSTVCPTNMATLAQAQARLGKAAESVQVVFVTVDPARDQAAHLRTYLAAFDPAFVGATGSPEALAAVRKRYGVTAVRHGTGEDYVVEHTSSIFLIDRRGRLRAMMPFGRDPEDLVHDVRLLLKG